MTGLQNPPERYLAVRPDMATMDMLQWRGNYSFSRSIRAVTGEKENHTSAVIRFPSYGRERVWSIEALEQGLLVCPLSKLLARYDGKCWWYPLRDRYRCKAGAAAAWLMERVGVTPYDWPGCASNWRRLLGRDPAPAEESQLFCSESVFLAWRDGARLPGLKNIRFAPVPGKPMENIGLWQTRIRIL